MMLRSLFLITFFFLFWQSTAQEDSIAISESGTWVITSSWPEMEWDPQWNTYVPVAHFAYDMYKTGGDTIINSVNYKKLNWYPLDYDGNGNYSYWGPNEGIYRLAYRNENKRAFRILADSTNERVWYDFNYNIGDTIFETEQPAAFLQNQMYVTGSDSVSYCDSMYKSFFVSHNAGYNDTIRRIVQRVGATYNLVDNNWYMDNYWYDLTFFCESPTEINDLYNLLGSVENVSEQIAVHPNPVDNILFINSESSNIEYEISNSFGQVVDFGFTNGSINVELLDTGIYILNIPKSNVYFRFIKI